MSAQRVFLVILAVLSLILVLGAQNAVYSEQAWPREVTSVRLVDPLPLPVSGDLSGSVQARQSGRWDVNATLVNQPISVVPLGASVDSRAANAVGGEVTMFCPPGASECQHFSTSQPCIGGANLNCAIFGSPPSGATLVIEQITARLNGSLIDPILVVSVNQTQLPGPAGSFSPMVSFYFPLSPEAVSQDAWALNFPVRLYSLGSVSLRISHDFNNPISAGFASISANGYLVPR